MNDYKSFEEANKQPAIDMLRQLCEEVHREQNPDSIDAARIIECDYRAEILNFMRTRQGWSEYIAALHFPTGMDFPLAYMDSRAVRECVDELLWDAFINMVEDIESHYFDILPVSYVARAV